MINTKMILKHFFSLIIFILYTICAGAQTFHNTCSDVVSGNAHGHILSVLDCDTPILITSTSQQSESSEITGVFVSTEPIKITPGDYGVRLLPVDHEENDPETGDRTHGETHVKGKKPPPGGRFMEFKKKQKKLISPNPANDKITINTGSNLNSIVVYNLYGTALIKKDFKNTSEDKFTVDIAKLDKGFYTIKLVFKDGKTQSETIIKN